jgi:hypothetical protein
MSGLTFAEKVISNNGKLKGHIVVVTEVPLAAEAVPTGVNILEPPWTQPLLHKALGW